MPEQLAFQQRLGNGGAIDLDQLAGGARAPRVDDVRDDFLAHAAFAGDEHAAVRGGDQGGVAEHGLRQRALGHDVNRASGLS